MGEELQEYNGKKGLWRTVGGRRIFIADGQSLSEAMEKSGKFNNTNKASGNKFTKFNDYDKTSIDLRDRKEDTSLFKYTDENGNLTKAREYVHKKIIDKFFDGKKPTGNKTFYMTGGGSATGKSTFVKNPDDYMGHDSKNCIVVDSDEIKKMLPEFDKNNKNIANYLHEESSALAKRIMRLAMDNGYECMLDGTGDGNADSVLKKIDEAHSKGYKVVASYGTVDVNTALARNEERYKTEGRKVPDKTVKASHRNVTRVLEAVGSKFDKVDLYDLSDFNNIKHIATGGGGENIHVVGNYQKEYDNFLSKKNIIVK